jgi:8-oxo-dGTP diphosphatase
LADQQAPRVVVCAAILTDGDRVLAAQRGGTGSLAGKWELPGGKVDPGEDPRDALVRECQEEMGCRIEAGAIYEVIHHAGAQTDILLLFYTARLVAGTPVALEHRELRWVTPAEMAGLDLLAPDRILPQLFQQRFPEFRPFP